MSLGKTLSRDLSFALYRKSIFVIKDVLIAAQYERGEDAVVAEAVLTDGAEHGEQISDP